jgi:Na+/H+-dicarboxylate symporter
VYGIDLSINELLTIILTSTLASVGTAGVPGVGMITLSMVLTSVGLPIEGIGLIMGVDRLLDMARTTVNVMGDCACTLVVSNMEGELDKSMYYGESAKIAS